MYRLHNLGGHLFKGLQQFGGSDGEHPGQAGHQAAALDLHAHFLFPGIDTANGHFQLFCCALTDEHIVLAAHIFDDGIVKLIAGHLDGSAFHHAAQRNDRHIGGTAADVHNHIAVGLGNLNAGADGRSHRLLDEIDLPGTGLGAGVDDGTLFHLGDDGRHTDDHIGLEQTEAQHLMDEFLNHFLRHFIIGDDAVPQGTHSNDVARCTAQHFLGILTDGQDLAGGLVHRYNRRLAQNDALTFYINQYGSRTQINSDIAC